MVDFGHDTRLTVGVVKYYSLQPEILGKTNKQAVADW